MNELYSGLLWLARPSAKREVEIEEAVTYTEAKHGKRVQLIIHPPGESYPAQWRDILMRPDKRIMAHHLFMVTGMENDAAVGM